MSRSPCSPLIHFLTGAPCWEDFGLADWDLLVQQARSHRLLARIAAQIDDQDYWSEIPEEVCPHLRTSLLSAKRQHRDLLWELRQINRALADLNCPVTLLKGAAYVAAGYQAGGGRFFSDIDLMVPEKNIGEAEKRLVNAGWVHTKIDPYDQQYYRKWTHQIPPLQHEFRKSTIDLHHTIVPKTARIDLSSAELFKKIHSPSSCDPFFVLAPEDMVLHSAVHLFNDGELSHGLRDLVDLHDLVRQFSTDAQFWPRLLRRAVVLDLRRPLAYAIHCHSRIFSMTLPGAPQREWPSWLPPYPVRKLMESLFDEGLSPDHYRERGLFASLVDYVIDIRGHYLRMPLHLLIPHLIYKATRNDPQEPGHPLPLPISRNERLIDQGTR